MQTIDDITGQIVDAALKIHQSIGPGLLESVYEVMLARELEKRGLKVQRQLVVPFEFDGQKYDDGLRLDLLVADKIIVELKSVEKIAEVHPKQLLTYLRLMKLRIGLLINFGSPTLKDGLKRVINGYEPPAIASASI
ncbi:MAG: GxxExxY protein [Phycisphaerae bacterium]